jgi:hypothetical protein
MPDSLADKVAAATRSRAARVRPNHRTTGPAAPRDVQIAARHADPRTTMCYHRARKNLDRNPNYTSLAALMTSGTRAGGLITGLPC